MNIRLPHLCDGILIHFRLLLSRPYGRSILLEDRTLFIPDAHAIVLKFVDVRRRKCPLLRLTDRHDGSLEVGTNHSECILDPGCSNRTNSAVSVGQGKSVRVYSIRLS